MLMTRDVLELLDAIAPFAIADDWDNSGLQAGNLNWEVKKMIIGLDVSMDLMNAAQKGNCDLVLTHHPLMIHPEKSIDFSKMPGSVIEMAASNKISIISVHTNLDKANNGLNDYFAEKIGIRETRPFLTDEVPGTGRIGTLESQIPLQQLVLNIKKQLNLNYLRVTGPMDLPIRSVAVCTGSGGSLLDEFLASRADAYITGDIKYHEARRIEEVSRALIDVGHFSSEHMVVELLFEKLSQVVVNAGLNIEIEQYKKEKDPFTIV